MQRFKKALQLLFFSFAFSLLLYSPVFAAGEGNIDGGGGGMGEGTETDVWRNNMDGIRITVVTSDGSVAATPFDLTNFNIWDNVIHFGKVSKVSYTAGTALSPGGSSYSCSKPSTALPRIVSGSVNRANVEAIKRYFCSEYAAQLVSDKTGIAFDNLISGSYKLVIEPMAYFIHGGRYYAMTATEAALYNQLAGGSLRRTLTSLTHQNLPLSIFLEVSDLGYPAWTGTTTDRVSDTDIISSLGIGIVNYTDVPETEFQTPDYTYRVDTDVITSITISSATEVNPDNPASVTFNINGTTHTVQNIVIPAEGSQVVWVKWHTPTTPTSIPITVSVSGATTGQTSFLARIVSLEDNIPPDPLATDTNPHFRTPSLPGTPNHTSTSWSVWSAAWEENWEWEADWDWESADCNEECEEDCTENHGEWVDNGDWVDNGWYEFTATSYSASLTASMELSPDDIVPTADGDNMKSGYGVKQNTSATVSTNAPASHYSYAQTGISYFPEFDYGSYWRLLQCDLTNPASFTFKANGYSTYNRNVHFTPVWYPNGSYAAYTHLIDAWTPNGMLSINVSDSVTIAGSMFDDWYTKRE